MKLIQHDTIILVVEDKGKFLFIKRKNQPGKGMWAIPGGHRDPGENIEECAAREGLEEIGPVEVEPLWVFVHDVEIGHRHRAHVFRGRMTGPVRAGDDAEEARWLSLEDINTLDGKGKIIQSSLRVVNQLLFGEADLKAGGIRGTAGERITKKAGNGF